MENILDKIRKLFALAENHAATEAEAVAAMERAHALMLKYNIDQATIKRPKEEAQPVGFGELIRTSKPHEDRVAFAVAELYDCRGIYWSDRLPGETKVKRVGIRIVGLPHNVQAAQITYYYLMTQLEAQYKIHLPRGLSKRERAVFRGDFKLGCAITLQQRIKAIIENVKTGKVSIGCNALVVVENSLVRQREIDEFLDGKVKTVSGRTQTVKSSSAFEKGARAGHNVHIQDRVQ